MSTEVQFYHLLATPLERALPKLMEKALESGFRILILAESEEKTESLNRLLWTYNPNSFLPHGSGKDAHAERQPIYLTYKPENPNKADLLVVTDGSELDELSDFKRVLDIFDGADGDAVSAARKRWKAYKDAGHQLTYIKQTPKGGWQQMAEAA